MKKSKKGITRGRGNKSKSWKRKKLGIHIPKRSQIVKNTTNNREYKIWVKHLEDPLSCWYCSPHEGCNYWRNRKPKKSWKFLSKRRRQYKDI
jgi:hypothetical protein